MAHLECINVPYRRWHILDSIFDSDHSEHVKWIIRLWPKSLYYLIKGRQRSKTENMDCQIPRLSEKKPSDGI